MEVTKLYKGASRIMHAIWISWDTERNIFKVGVTLPARNERDHAQIKTVAYISDWNDAELFAMGLEEMYMAIDGQKEETDENR